MGLSGYFFVLCFVIVVAEVLLVGTVSISSHCKFWSGTESVIPLTVWFFVCRVVLIVLLFDCDIIWVDRGLWAVESNSGWPTNCT